MKMSQSPQPTFKSSVEDDLKKLITLDSPPPSCSKTKVLHTSILFIRDFDIIMYCTCDFLCLTEYRSRVCLLLQAVLVFQPLFSLSTPSPRSLQRTFSDESIFSGQRVLTAARQSANLFGRSTMPRSPSARSASLHQPSYTQGAKSLGERRSRDESLFRLGAAIIVSDTL